MNVIKKSICSESRIAKPNVDNAIRPPTGLGLGQPQTVSNLGQLLIWSLFFTVSIFPSLSQGQELTSAIRSGDLESVKKVVEANPKLLTTRDNQGRYPLHLAVNSNKNNIVDYLLSQKADPE